MTTAEIENYCVREGLRSLLTGDVGRKHEHARENVTRGDSKEYTGAKIGNLSEHLMN